MKRFKRRVMLAGGLCALAAALPAAAETGKFGSAQLATYRTCVGVADNETCGIVGDGGSEILQQVYGGGLGQFGSANLDLDRSDPMEQAFAHSTVSRGEQFLPVIRGETRAGFDDRMAINSIGFQSYRWTGLDETAFSLAGNLHFVDSAYQQGFPTTVPGGGNLRGGSTFDAYEAVWDPSILGSYTSAGDLVANLLLARCGTAGVLGVGIRTGVSLRGGEANYSVATSECSAGSLTLRPDQEILSVSTFRLRSQRGGFADATYTFATVFDPALSADVRASLQQNLVAATVLPGVPEPATWALMIVGFGATGAALRRKRRSRPAFA